MKVKASLHIHTAEDKTEGEFITYNIFELIDRASELGFQVLALTCHQFCVTTKEHIDYAKNKGMLLLSGVELNLIENNKVCHTLAINCPKVAENVKTFRELADFKKQHPEILIIAAHPNFGFGASMGLANLKKYINLFDAVEISWFYNIFLNLNKKSLAVARQAGKTVVATADLHQFNEKCLATDYCILEVASLTAEEVVRAVKKGKVENFSKPKSLVYFLSSIVRIIWHDFIGVKFYKNLH